MVDISCQIPAGRELEGIPNKRKKSLFYGFVRLLFFSPFPDMMKPAQGIGASLEPEAE
jgi:hypothetical protein